MNADKTEFDSQMAVARRVMDERWIALRALALGDQHPELDADARVALAKQQAQELGRPVRN
jgi:hypothetical protein